MSLGFLLWSSIISINKERSLHQTTTTKQTCAIPTSPRKMFKPKEESGYPWVFVPKYCYIAHTCKPLEHLPLMMLSSIFGDTMHNLKFNSSVGPKSNQHKRHVARRSTCKFGICNQSEISTLKYNKKVRYIEINLVYQFYFGTNGSQPKCASRLLIILAHLITRFPFLSSHPFMSSTDSHSDMEP